MDFEIFKIKEYRMWDLYVHKNQYPYLGRCYAWARREDANFVEDMDAGECEELFEFVLPDWRGAMDRLWVPDRTNLACLGNTAPHLLWHFIPRYLSAREFMGVTFVDPNPSGNYAPYDRVELDDDLVLAVRREILEVLDGFKEIADLDNL